MKTKFTIGLMVLGLAGCALPSVKPPLYQSIDCTQFRREQDCIQLRQELKLAHERRELQRGLLAAARDIDEQNARNAALTAQIQRQLQFSSGFALGQMMSVPP